MGLFDLFKSKKQPMPAEARDMAAKFVLMAFPGGESQVNEEAAQLHALLRGKLPKSTVRQLLCRTKALLIVAEDKSETRIVPSIQAKADGQLTLHECKIVYQFLTGVLGALLEEGDGGTKESAVVINATSSIVGIDAEYQWLTTRFGKQDRDWKIDIRMQSDDNGQSYEMFVIELSDGSSKTIYFDISSFYGRF
jgi:hypothetical protein